MPITFWGIFYVAQITGSSKKCLMVTHCDRLGGLHELAMDHFSIPGELDITIGKVYLIHGICLFEEDKLPLVLSSCCVL